MKNEMKNQIKPMQLLTVLLYVAASFMTSPAFAQISYTQEAVVQGDQIPNPEVPWWIGHDWYGSSIDIDGDTAVVGAKNEAVGTGAVYIYVRDGAGWSRQAKIIPADLDVIRFGRSVAISGDTVIVGEIDGSDYQGSGSAYVYVRNGTTWSQQARLDGFTVDMKIPFMDGFGMWVDIDGDTAIVTAWHDDDLKQLPDISGNTGALHVFVRNGTTWTKQAKLYPDDIEGNQHFGRGIALEGDTILVSSLADLNEQGERVGSAYVFVRENGNWIQRDKLEPSDGVGGDKFGLEMSVNRDTFLIAASGDYTNGIRAGSAYIFERDGCNISEVTKLVPSDGFTDQGFGIEVSVSGDIAVIGAFSDKDFGSQSGAVYVYKRDAGSWSEAGKIYPDDIAASYRFGYFTKVKNDTLLVGALLDLYGKVYMFDLEEGNVHSEPQTDICFDGCHP
jgi:hypothetical protein